MNVENYSCNQNERIDELGIDNLKIVQNTQYFCFGTDSVLLANFAKSDKKKNIVLDLCSGSGVIPILFQAKNEYGHIFAVELQQEMYELLEKNISLNHLDIVSMKQDVKNIKEIRTMIEEKTGRNTVDVITVNPPYKPKNTGIINEQSVKYIARHEECCSLKDIFKVASNLLETKGKLYLVHKPQRLVDLLAIAREYHLEAKRIRFVYPRMELSPSIVLVEYTKNGGNEMNVMPPLIEYNSDLTYTDELYKLYGMEKK